MYLYDENVSKQTSIAPWQRGWIDYVYKEKESDQAVILQWQPHFTCELMCWKCD